jgi:hypothetical protein
MLIFMKIRSVGPELFHADRRTDMTELMITFRNSADAPKRKVFRDYSTQISRFLIEETSRRVVDEPYWQLHAEG